MLATDDLPAFLADDPRDQPALDASRRIVALFLRERSTDFPIRDLADHAGLSERTFYRYFPRKEDAVRPYLQAALAHVVAQVRDAPAHVSAFDAVLTAQGAILDAATAHDAPAMLAVLVETERLRAVWLQVLHDAEAAYAHALAERLGLADGLRAHLAGAAVVAAGRLALLHAASSGRRASDLLAEALTLVAHDLLQPAPEAR